MFFLRHTLRHVPKLSDTLPSAATFVTSKLWRDTGCTKVLLNSPLLAAVMRGIRRGLLAPPDQRAAFILALYISSSYYVTPPSIEWLQLKVSVALGFNAMQRFRAFCQLTPSSLTLILNDGDEWSLYPTP